MRHSELTQELQATAEQSYNQLDGDWHDWLEVARKYEHKVLAQDRLDIRHTIILELHHAWQRDGKPIPILRAYRIASLTVAFYWRQLKRQPTILSLEDELDIGEGDIIQLKDTIADDKAIDLSAWLDAKTWLLGCPMRLIKIGVKKRYGLALTSKEKQYLWRFRKKEQKKLF